MKITHGKKWKLRFPPLTDREFACVSLASLALLTILLVTVQLTPNIFASHTTSSLVVRMIFVLLHVGFTVLAVPYLTKLLKRQAPNANEQAQASAVSYLNAIPKDLTPNCFIDKRDVSLWVRDIKQATRTLNQAVEYSPLPTLSSDLENFNRYRQQLNSIDRACARISGLGEVSRMSLGKIKTRLDELISSKRKVTTFSPEQSFELIDRDLNAHLAKMAEKNTSLERSTSQLDCRLTPSSSKITELLLFLSKACEHIHNSEKLITEFDQAIKNVQDRQEQSASTCSTIKQNFATFNRKLSDLMNRLEFVGGSSELNATADDIMSVLHQGNNNGAVVEIEHQKFTEACNDIKQLKILQRNLVSSIDQLTAINGKDDSELAKGRRVVKRQQTEQHHAEKALKSAYSRGEEFSGLMEEVLKFIGEIPKHSEACSSIPNQIADSFSTAADTNRGLIEMMEKDRSDLIHIECMVNQLHRRLENLQAACVETHDMSTAINQWVNSLNKGTLAIPLKKESLEIVSQSILRIESITNEIEKTSSVRDGDDQAGKIA